MSTHPIKIFLLSFFLFFTHLSVAENIQESQSLENLFLNKNTQGTLVIYDHKNQQFIIKNTQRAKEAFYPASTFKIFHSLIALDQNVVSSVSEIFYKYDGSKVFLPSWANDASLQSAIKISQVPAYQKLARLITLKGRQEGLKKIGYGNTKTGNALTTFWLQGPLKISAIEQTILLDRLAHQELPFSKNDQKSVAKIILLHKTDTYTLYGKTGWATDNISIPIGWFVGWLETQENQYAFALNINAPTSKELPLREELVFEAFKKLKIIQ